MDKKKISIVLGLMCLVLTWAIVVQIKTINKNIGSSDPTQIENDLRDEVLRWKERYDDSYAELEKAEKELEKERTNAAKNDDTSSQKEEELKIGSTILGTTDVKGKGVIITLRDNQTIKSDSLLPTDDIGKYLVHEADLLNVINELKNAGAEAISINDQRIVPTTAIICSGNVTQVNGEKVGAPFVIKAIGKPDELKENLNRPGGTLDLMKSSVVVDVETSNNLTIMKYDGVMQSKYLKAMK